MASGSTPTGPDFTKGVEAAAIADGATVAGRVGDDEVVLARSGDTLFAIGAHCTHYRGSLVDGLIVGETIRCPLHHACFSLRTGEAIRAPALDPVPCWRVDREGDRVFVREKIAAPPAAATPAAPPASIVIVGGGAAGLAAADMLRRRGYTGPVTMVSADHDAPVDRPNLSKDYLAGEAQEDWIPLWPADLYVERGIELVLGRRVVGLDPAARSIALDDGSTRGFGALLLATGADPVRIPVPGATDDQIFYLRTFADSKRIVERAGRAGRAAETKRVVVVGASFIGLEVAASLRARGIAVDVVAPDAVPLARVMGPDVGRFVQGLHEAKGVTFHLGQTVARVAGRVVTLSGGATIDADFLVLGVGVRPATELAERAGLTVDRGISVSNRLETSEAGIFAAGDNARWPDRHSGERIRVEHWVVAERQGQVAAENMLGRHVTFDAVPFFWSQHYDVTIRYVGHAERWDRLTIDGRLDDRDCEVTYWESGKPLAVATIGRDRGSLQAEARLERR